MCLLLMMRTSLALLKLVLVVCVYSVSGMGGTIGEGGVSGDAGVTTSKVVVTSADGVSSEGGVNIEGGSVTKKGVVHTNNFGEYYLIKSNTTMVNTTGEIKWKRNNEDEYVELTCPNVGNTDTALEDIRFPSFSDMTQSTTLSFMHCPVPRGSYADVLIALNYQATDLKKLYLFFWSIQFLQASHFIGLTVKTLRLYHSMNRGRLVSFDPIILEPLSDLTHLTIHNVILFPMPASSRLQSVTTVNGKSQGAWGGCDQLKKLMLMAWDVHNPTNISLNWLADCPKLRLLVMSQLLMPSIAQILPGAKIWGLAITETVPYLNMQFLKINLKGLEFLNLTNNQLGEIKIADIPKSLKELDLSHNELEDFPWLKLQKLRPSLRKLTLDNNPLAIKHDVCDQLTATVPQATLQELSLTNTGATRLCFSKWVSLRQLDLRNNNITMLELLELPEPSEEYERTAVDLRGNPISNVPLTEEGYNTLLNKFNKYGVVSVWVDSDVNCDCEHAWFARALRLLPSLRVRDPRRGSVRCRYGKAVVNTSAEHLECEMFFCGGCECRRSWRDNTTEAFCQVWMGLQRIPHVPGLRALHAVSNRIETLHDDDLPESLLKLDLRYNLLLRLNDSVVNKLFSIPERRVWLAGNPLLCNCDNYVLVSALQQHHEQVADYSDIVCVDSEQALHSVDVAELCAVTGGQVAVTATLVASGVLVALVALAAAVYCRYERPLRIFLYARGWCLCCMQDDSADDDRLFDAFVSFAHADESLVTEQLLPRLKDAYKLCVHFRDWQPGELIPTQIRLSVERSRRTIIILSRNFLQSMWAMLEFRTAHVSALTEGRVRVVVIVLDDVLHDEGLDAELQGYLRTHTYLRWKDPWFWEKLCYALPHRRIPSTDDPQHPAPQPFIVPGDVNLSPHD